MRIVIIDENITMLIADEGKMLTDREIYCYDVRLAHSEDVSKWEEIDEQIAQQQKEEWEQAHADDTGEVYE